MAGYAVINSTLYIVEFRICPLMFEYVNWGNKSAIKTMRLRYPNGRYFCTKHAHNDMCVSKHMKEIIVSSYLSLARTPASHKNHIIQ